MLLLSCIAGGYRVWTLESERRAVKADLKELSHVTYGLFNVDEWVAVVSLIIERKVDQLQVTEENRPELRAQLVVIMRAMIDELEGSMDRANDKAGFKGDVRKAAMGLLVDLKAIKADAPHYADRLLDELNKPASRARIQSLLRKELGKMTDSTSSFADYGMRDAILQRAGCSDVPTAITSLNTREYVLEEASQQAVRWMLAGLLALVLLISVAGANAKTDLYLLFFGSCVLLIMGVQLPMIDIEAGISCFSLRLIGEEIQFQDQVLYYQSKSLLEVVWLLLTDRDTGLVLVGVLVLLFSLLLPITKLLGTLLVLFTRRRPRSGFGKFIVYRSGKWSMADVLVVAIFMTYLGFRGIVNGQLAQLRMDDGRAQLMTTNGSQLQVGFYLFLAYCIMGLVLSTLVQRKYADGSPSGQHLRKGDGQ